METWRELSYDALRGAEVLLAQGHYRSSVSRAYYAAYCGVTNEVIKKIKTFPRGWKNPPHELLPIYVKNNLTITRAQKEEIAIDLRLLRLFREDADYRPETIIDEATARDCIRVAAEIQQVLWGTT